MIPQTVLVTGACGFQGIHLTKELLRNEHVVYGLNVPNKDAEDNYAWLKKQVSEEEYGSFHMIWGSITDLQLLKRLVPKVSTIFHLAAKVSVDESIINPFDFFETNIRGTYEILELAKENDTRVILASSCEVYGGGEDIDENTVLNPQSPYAASKTAADRIAYAYAKTYELRVDIVRPFNVYGPRQKAHSSGAVIPIFFKKVMNGDPIQIYGDGMQGRDFNYVETVISMYMNIFNNPKSTNPNLYTFGSGVLTSVNDLAKMIMEIVGRTVPIEYVPNRKGQVPLFKAKNSIQKYFPGWGIEPTMYDGLRKYYDSLLEEQI
jgi:dTDP-glucose 4,6-dehydratase